jgi:thiol-disulfide isomerase/thioredoxin
MVNAMKGRVLLLLVSSLGFPLVRAGVVEDVVGALNHADFPKAEAYIHSYRASHGVTPEALEAMSWMARAALDLKKYDQAEKYADETYQLSKSELAKRRLDQEPHLPLALGAAIEVEANVMAARGVRVQALAYLREQRQKYYATSIRARIQKNINLLTLEGKPAPLLERVTLPKGKPALIFFWAHWCGDCHAEVPVLAQLKAEFESKGLAMLGPTQMYGYVAGGKDASPAAEASYIEQVRQRYYASIFTGPAPVNSANFLRYGASTVPTLVLVDRGGIVRLYHPGAMTYAELRPQVEKLFR